MNAYNPLSATHRLEAAGLDRKQAEAIASEIGDSKSDLVTNETFDIKMEAALNKQLVRFGVLMAGIMAVATTILGTLISLK